MPYTDEIPLIAGIVLDDDPTSYTSAWVDVSEYGRLTLLLQSTKANAPTSVTYSFEVLVGATGVGATGQPTGGTARAYDKMQATGGSDAPVASVAHTDTTTAWVSRSFEDTFKWFRVKAVGAGTTSSATFTSVVTLFGQP